MTAIQDLRKPIVTTLVVSFSVAACLGVLALLGSDFGETQARVLVTTAVVGVESVALLCYLSLADHRLAAVGVVGGLVSLVATALALALTWGGPGEPWVELGVAVTVAASLAQASLLISTAGRPRVTGGVALTLVAIAVVAVMVIVPLTGLAAADGGGYWRVLGAVAILDVLGTVVLTARAAFGGGEDDARRPSLSPAVERRLVEAAASRGVSPDALVAELLDGRTPDGRR